MNIISKKFRNSIQFKFLTVMSAIVLIGTVVSTIVITNNEKETFDKSLRTKGQGIASLVAKLSAEPLVLKDNLLLDSIVNDANEDDDVAYAIIRDPQSNLLTSQFSSFNYHSAEIRAGIAAIPKESSFEDMISAVRKYATVIEISVPVMVDIETVGTVTIGMSRGAVTKELMKTVMAVVALNIAVAFVLGAALFIATKRVILNPISRLADTASSLARGEIATLIDMKTSGEVKMLVDSFNQMALNLDNTTVSKDYVNSIINSMLDSLLVVAPDGMIVSVNAAVCKVLGYEEDELLGRRIEMIFEIGQDSSDSIMGEMTSKGFLNNTETRCRAKNGAAITMIFSGAAISGDGRLQSMVLVAKDVTEFKMLEEFKRTQEEQVKIQKLESVGLLAGGIAHDFNNLLTAILGNISLVKMKTPTESQTYELLYKAEMASLRARDLTRQLLTFSKGGVPVKKTISLADLLVNTVRMSLSGAKTACDLQIPADLHPVDADEGQINQVFNNLVINADQAMPNGGRLTIACENIVIDDENGLPMKNGRAVRIDFADQGCGIHPDCLSKVFDPYYTSKTQGSGLGLAVVYSIIKKHCGYICVESDVGAGTKFTIYLPASESGDLAKNVEDKQITYGTGRILLMDDEENIRSVTGEMIRQIGYEVDYAEEGAEAVGMYAEALASGRRYDAVIMDLTIPGGMGGQEAFSKIIEIDPKANGIVSSGYSNNPVMSDFAKYGFKGTVQKPYCVSELSQQIRNVLI